MAPFTEREIREHFFIWQLFRDGPVALVHHESILGKLSSDLQERDYRVFDIDCRLEEEHDLQRHLRDALGMDAGISRDGLAWELSDLPFGESTGIVVILSHIDKFVERYPEYFWSIVDIFVVEAKMRILLGERLLVLLHANDENIKTVPLGAVMPARSLMRRVDAESPSKETE